MGTSKRLSIPSEQFLLEQQSIEQKIFLIRGKKVLLDRHLAKLYGVETKVLNQAVKRNIERFPGDFVFQLTWEESKSSRSQIVTLNKSKVNQKGTNLKYLSYAFTEQGVAMLSSVLNSPRAIQVNIQIMRTFTRIREMMMTHKDLQDRLIDLFLIKRTERPFNVVDPRMGVRSDIKEKLNKEIEEKFEEKFAKHDQQFKLVFKAIHRLIEPQQKSKEPIGFHPKIV